VLLRKIELLSRLSLGVRRNHGLRLNQTAPYQKAISLRSRTTKNRFSSLYPANGKIPQENITSITAFHCNLLQRAERLRKRSGTDAQTLRITSDCFGIDRGSKVAQTPPLGLRLFLQILAFSSAGNEPSYNSAFGAINTDINTPRLVHLALRLRF